LGVVLVAVRHGQWIRSDLQVSDLVSAVVLRNDCSAVGDIIQQPFIVSAQVVTHSVGTNAENYSGKFREIGVRAYAVRDDLRAYNKRLLDYVANGGTIVAQ